MADLAAMPDLVVDGITVWLNAKSHGNLRLVCRNLYTKATNKLFRQYFTERVTDLSEPSLDDLIEFCESPMAKCTTTLVVRQLHCGETYIPHNCHPDLWRWYHEVYSLEEWLQDPRLRRKLTIVMFRLPKLAAVHSSFKVFTGIRSRHRYVEIRTDRFPALLVQWHWICNFRFVNYIAALIAAVVDDANWVAATGSHPHSIEEVGLITVSLNWDKISLFDLPYSQIKPRLRRAIQRDELGKPRGVKSLSILSAVGTADWRVLLTNRSIAKMMLPAAVGYWSHSLERLRIDCAPDPLYTADDLINDDLIYICQDLARQTFPELLRCDLSGVYIKPDALAEFVSDAAPALEHLEIRESQLAPEEANWEQAIARAFLGSNKHPTLRLVRLANLDARRTGIVRFGPNREPVVELNRQDGDFDRPVQSFALSGTFRNGWPAHLRRRCNSLGFR